VTCGRRGGQAVLAGAPLPSTFRVGAETVRLQAGYQCIGIGLVREGPRDDGPEAAPELREFPAIQDLRVGEARGLERLRRLLGLGASVRGRLVHACGQHDPGCLAGRGRRRTRCGRRGAAGGLPGHKLDRRNSRTTAPGRGAWNATSRCPSRPPCSPHRPPGRAFRTRRSPSCRQSRMSLNETAWGTARPRRLPRRPDVPGGIRPGSWDSRNTRTSRRTSVRSRNPCPTTSRPGSRPTERPSTASRTEIRHRNGRPKRPCNRSCRCASWGLRFRRSRPRS